MSFVNAFGSIGQLVTKVFAILWDKWLKGGPHIFDVEENIRLLGTHQSASWRTFGISDDSPSDQPAVTSGHLSPTDAESGVPPPGGIPTGLQGDCASGSSARPPRHSSRPPAVAALGPPGIVIPRFRGRCSRRCCG